MIAEDAVQQVERRVSRLSIAFSIAGLAMGLACWAGVAAYLLYPHHEFTAIVGWCLLVGGGSFVLLLGLAFSAVAYVPRGRAWPLATVSLLVNLTCPAFFAGLGVGMGLKVALLAVGAVCVVVGAAVGAVLGVARIARRGSWSGRARAAALTVGLCGVGLLALVLLVLLVG